MICAFTGHRPKRLPWGSNEDDPYCQALKIMLRRTVEQAIQRGCCHFLCGMALGCDTYFAETVLAVKQDAAHIRLEALVPCLDQAEHWSAADRRRYEDLLARCDVVTVLEDTYTEGCMQRRNQVMVDRADLLITIWDGSAGGTGSTVRYARKKGLELLSIWV